MTSAYLCTHATNDNERRSSSAAPQGALGHLVVVRSNWQESAACVTPSAWVFGDQVADVDSVATLLAILGQLSHDGFAKRIVMLYPSLDCHHVLVLRVWFDG